MNDILDLTSSITIKRRATITATTSIRPQYTATTFTIQGIVNTTSSNNINTTITTQKGQFSTGEIMLITDQDLHLSKDGVEDIVVMPDGEYRIKSKEIYTNIIPHFEYICSRII